MRECSLPSAFLRIQCLNAAACASIRYRTFLQARTYFCNPKAALPSTVRSVFRWRCRFTRHSTLEEDTRVLDMDRPIRERRKLFQPTLRSSSNEDPRGTKQSTCVRGVRHAFQ